MARGAIAALLTIRQLTDLRVSPAQEKYVASNAVSIAQAYFHREEAWFRSIHAGDLLVGFVMLRDLTLMKDPPPVVSLSLWRFMIDHRHQGLGYGFKALDLVVAHARTRPGIDVLHTSYVEGNDGPSKFYPSFGFRPNGEIMPSGEICLALRRVEGTGRRLLHHRCEVARQGHSLGAPRALGTRHRRRAGDPAVDRGGRSPA